MFSPAWLDRLKMCNRYGGSRRVETPPVANVGQPRIRDRVALAARLSSRAGGMPVPVSTITADSRISYMYMTSLK
jgi:hypothetical protein